MASDKPRRDSRINEPPLPGSRPLAGPFEHLKVRHAPKTEQQRQVVAEAAGETFGQTAQILLFGCCLDNDRWGGDIDLLVQCPSPVESAGIAAASMAAKIQLRLAERKVDVLYWWPGMR